MNGSGHLFISSERSARATLCQLKGCDVKRGCQTEIWPTWDKIGTLAVTSRPLLWNITTDLPQLTSGYEPFSCLHKRHWKESEKRMGKSSVIYSVISGKSQKLSFYRFHIFFVSKQTTVNSFNHGSMRQITDKWPVVSVTLKTCCSIQEFYFEFDLDFIGSV